MHHVFCHPTVAECRQIASQLQQKLDMSVLVYYRPAAGTLLT